MRTTAGTMTTGMMTKWDDDEWDDDDDWSEDSLWDTDGEHAGSAEEPDDPR